MMSKLMRAAGVTSLFCIAVLAFTPSTALAGDDTELAKELYEQAKAKDRESSAAVDKVQEAFDRGDLAAACDYARQSQQATQVSYDLALRMTNLDLDPQNAEVARGYLSVTRALLESGNALLNTPECNPPVEPVYESTNAEDLEKLNTAVAIGRQMDADGRMSYAGEEWMLACAYLGAAKGVYASNSRSALELSQRFSAEDNPQPQLEELSDELAELENAVTPKRDTACENEKAGG